MITVEQIIEEVKRLGREHPHAKYTEDDCSYLHGENGYKRCGCIVGVAIMNLDSSLEPTLQEADSKPGGLDVSGLLDLLKIEYTGDQVAWLMDVQSFQDARETWGDAVCAARKL